MMGTKIRTFSPLPDDLSLEELVPKDNFYRRLQARLDLSFVRELVGPLYAGWCEPIFPDSAHSQLPAFRTCSASNSTGGRYPRLECNLFWL